MSKSKINSYIEKMFLLSSAALVSAVSCFAQAPDGGSDHWQNGGPVNTFWGTKTRKSSINPCRGATIRKCAEVVPQNGVAPLSLTGQASMITMVLRVPLDTPQRDFEEMKKLEKEVPGLKVVRGLIEETTTEKR